MHLLPKRKINHHLRILKQTFSQAKTDPQGFLHYLMEISKSYISKRGKYLFAACIDITIIAVILINAGQPTHRLISSLINSWQSNYAHATVQTTKEVFSFAPGSSHNKYKAIDFNGLKYLAFYDLPLTEDGINFDSNGYNSFTSDQTLNLIEKSKALNTKFLITISQTSDKTIQIILSDDTLQQKIIDQTIEEVKLAEIDGVVIDFEPKTLSYTHQDKFSQFVSKMRSAMHSQVPNSTVAVAVPSEAATTSPQNSFYNLTFLDQNVDKVLIMASNMIVPETQNASLKNPTYGYSETDYLKDLSKKVSDFTGIINQDKLVMERAFYGNGDRYPLYVPTGKPVLETEVEPAHVFLDSETVERLATGVPSKGRAAAIKNIPLIGKALEEEGILDSNVLAYALATIEHETAETFEPISEFHGAQSARRLGYEGGMNYYGRGFIQLTHLRNYRMVGERIGMGDALAKNPELASDPKIAAKILAAFFKDNNVANLASKGYFVAARTPINPDYNGSSIAMLAYKYEEESY